MYEQTKYIFPSQMLLKKVGIKLLSQIVQAGQRIYKKKVRGEGAITQNIF